MKGLLIKDFKLMKNQKSFFLLILAVAVGLAAVGEESSFIVSYVTFIGSIFTLSTISYDEYDNGNAYLFSLPITRKGYIIEKYGFGLMVGGASWLLGTVLSLVGGTIKGWGSPVDILMTSFIILPLFLIMLALMLPFQLKYGSEKGRVAMIGALGALFLIIFVIVTAVKAWNPDLIARLNAPTPEVNMGILIAAEMGIAALSFFFSGRISLSILDKKEF